MKQWCAESCTAGKGLSLSLKVKKKDCQRLILYPTIRYAYRYNALEDASIYRSIVAPLLSTNEFFLVWYWTHDRTGERSITATPLPFHKIYTSHFIWSKFIKVIEFVLSFADCYWIELCLSCEQRDLTKRTVHLVSTLSTCLRIGFFIGYFIGFFIGFFLGFFIGFFIGFCAFGLRMKRLPWALKVGCVNFHLFLIKCVNTLGTLCCWWVL